MLSGPAVPIWAACKDGVATGANHCSRRAGSHSWPSTFEACAPPKVVSNICRGSQAGRLSLHCTRHL